MQHLAQMQYADSVVDAVMIDRHAGALAVSDLPFYVFPVIGEIDAGNLVAWNHNVFNAGVFKIRMRSNISEC